MFKYGMDYSRGAYPPILERMVESNLMQDTGYGLDEHCEKAIHLIKKECNKENVEVHFMVGGTQVNLTVISSILRPYEGVISPDSGHISGMETGAIEATGHKVLTLPNTNGKITAEQVRLVCMTHENDGGKNHKVRPGMVYISQPTEFGTLYSKKELEALHKVCKDMNVPLFVDGARLGYGIAAKENDVTIEDLANLADVFYIGGTKQGALFGEAVVISNLAYANGFRYLMKQKGGLLAKGYLLGIQFEVLFEDGAYYRIAEQAVEYSQEIKEAFIAKGYQLLLESPTNQQFIILPKSEADKYINDFGFLLWEELEGDYVAIRLVTCWSTTREQVDTLLAAI